MATNATWNGTTTLNSGNSYGGGPTVRAGALFVNNSTGSGTGNGTVTLSNTGTLSGSGTISGSVNVSGSHTGGDGNDLVLTAVPEPDTWAAGGLALGGLISWQRRRFARFFKRGV